MTNNFSVSESQAITAIRRHETGETWKAIAESLAVGKYALEAALQRQKDKQRHESCLTLAKDWLAMPDNPTSLQAEICDQLAWAIETEEYAAGPVSTMVPALRELVAALDGVPDRRVRYIEFEGKGPWIWLTVDTSPAPRGVVNGMDAWGPRQDVRVFAVPGEKGDSTEDIVAALVAP